MISSPDYLYTISLTELYDTAYRPKIMVVDNLLCSGVYLFAGAPKVGKSFFMAQLGYHVSSGVPLWEHTVHKGTVLYLALEDDYARLQKRLSRMFGMEGIDNFHFATHAKNLREGLDGQLKKFIREHPDTKLIIIDNRDVYHYHLHVVYIPVVEKEIRWTKRCKDKALAGTVKEVINQVSHSKKWASVKALDENGEPIRTEDGKAVLIPSYSLLQDRFFEHMRNAGFKDFERGVRGSTTQHLSVLDYKIQQDNAKLTRIEQEVEAQQKELDTVSKQLTVEWQIGKTFHELDELGRKKMFGKVTLAEQDLKEVISLAKEGVLSHGKIHTLVQQAQKATARVWELEDKLTKLFMSTRDFKEAMRLAPERVRAVFAEIFSRDHEEREARRNMRHNSRKRDERER